MDHEKRLNARRAPARVSCLLILAATLIAADSPSDAPDPSWRLGPIRYILIVKEDQEYKTLGTEAERAAFIEKFWAALDPTPGTSENERRTEFWKRQAEADRMFQEGMTPGWRTDRGKFYILFGPPDEREQQGPYEIWKYIALPNREADPEVMVRFHRNSHGEFRVGMTKTEYWDPSQQSDGPAVGDTFLGVRTKNGTLEMMRGRFRMTQFPPTDVGADFATASLDYRLRYDYYMVKRDSTRVVVTLALSKEQFRGATGELQIPEIALSVAVDDAKKGKPVGSFTSRMQLAHDDSSHIGRPLLLQGSFIIEPGTYKAIVNILDRRSHRGAMRADTIDVPRFGSGLALSSLALGRLQDDPQEAHRTVGSGSEENRRLIPEPVSNFQQSDSILLAYEVYNVDQDGRAKPDLDVRYELFYITDAGPRQAGKPILLHHLSSKSLAYSLDLRAWPAGTFRWKVLVTDNRSGHRAEGEVDFDVTTSPS